MVAKTTLMAAVLGVWGITTVSAEAGGLCEDRDALVSKLKEIYHESHVASGLESASKMVEIWTGSSGSWTILVTRASGISCVVATGNNWLDLPKGAPALGTNS